MTPFLLHHKDDENMLGLAISEHVHFKVEKDSKTGKELVFPVPMIGVLWMNPDMHCPSPSYHNPNELQWLQVYVPDHEELSPEDFAEPEDNESEDSGEETQEQGDESEGDVSVDEAGLESETSEDEDEEDEDVSVDERSDDDDQGNEAQGGSSDVE